ncbi:hypothetical protein TELCIR_25091, partial [Teladorsagia circumcincta]
GWFRGCFNRYLDTVRSVVWNRCLYLCGIGSFDYEVWSRLRVFNGGVWASHWFYSSLDREHGNK